MSEPFIGEIRVFANSFVPGDCWFPCDGRQLVTNQYQALFAVIGTLYGGDGLNYFNLPDLQGFGPIHQGHGPGSSYQYRIGVPGGQAAVSLHSTEMPPHTHTAIATNAQATSNDPSGRIWARTSGVALYARTNDQPLAMKENALGVSGSGMGHSNVQPCLGMYFAIAWSGVFPPRP